MEEIDIQEIDKQRQNRIEGKTYQNNKLVGLQFHNILESRKHEKVS